MMRPLWKDLKNLDQWYEKIKTRPAYKKAIYDWGTLLQIKGSKR